MRAPSHTLDELTRLQADTPRATDPDVYAEGVRLTGRIRGRDWEGYVPAMVDHVLVAMREGPAKTFARMNGKEKEYPVQRGRITLIPAGQDGFHRAMGVEVSNVVLPPSRVLACAEQMGHARPLELICRISLEDARLYQIMDLIRAEVELGPMRSRLFLEQAIDLLCLQVLRAHSASGPPKIMRHRGLVSWQVKRVTAYMRENLDRDIGLQDLANLVSLSRFYFCSAFREATGYTPHEWLTRLRIEEARRLLAIGSMSITDIALAVGYQTPSAFTARFRQIQGMTPREFRRRL